MASSPERAGGGSWEARLHLDAPRALYLHIPFCRQKCAYCDFPSWACPRDGGVVGAYLESLERLLAQAADLGFLDDCRTAYVGGGTPSLLGPRLAGLVGLVRSRAPRITELTCESNPDSLDGGLLGELVSSGATRVSIGVQSLDDAELAELGRVHDARGAVRAVSAAVDSGLDVSCDLMCAIPRQTPESWRRSVEGVLSLGIGHLSVYPLSIEEGTELARRVGDGSPGWNDPDVQAERMEEARELIEVRGLARYEVASYARPGKRCLHNVAYWTGVPYLGLGTGASSMLTIEAYLRLMEACPQLQAPLEGSSRVRLVMRDLPKAVASAKRLSDLRFDVEFLDVREGAAEDLMLGSRLSSGIDQTLVEHSRLVLGQERVDEALASLIHEGLLDEGLAPTRSGWLLGNRVFGRLWDLAVPDGGA